MKKSILAVLTSIVLLTVFSGMALAAGNQTQLQFNGKNLPKDVQAVIISGRTLVPLEVIGQTLGADVKYDAASKKATIVKNDSIIEMTINSKEMYKNGQKVMQLPVPAQTVNGEIMVPVRSVTEALGAKVEWNEADRKVLLSFDEKRDGMTPEELMLKSNEALLKFNTYKFQGTAKIKMSMSKAGQKLETAMTMNGSYRKSGDNSEVYVKEVFSLPGTEKMPQSSMNMEIYTIGSKMYQNLNGAGWTELNLGIDLGELMKNQDPQSAVQMMKNFGLILSHGNKVNIEGKDYYTLVATIDSEKYKQFIKDVLFKTIQSTQGTANQQAAAELINSMDIKMNEKIIIDPETYLINKVDVTGQILMTAGQEKVTQDMNMTWSMTDYGKEVTMPDVNKK